jgi:hypothetical protein
VLDRPVLPAGVHRLEDDQDGVLPFGVELLLELVELLQILDDRRLGFLLVLEGSGLVGRSLAKFEPAARFDEVGRVDHGRKDT